MDINKFAGMMGDASYGLLANKGAWGLYCAVRAWRLLGDLKFKTIEEQDEFIDEFER